MVFKKCVIIVSILFCRTIVAQTADFPLFNGKTAAAIVYDSKGTPLDSISAYLLAQDVAMVTGIKPVVQASGKATADNAILIGNINSSFIKQYLQQPIPQNFLSQKESYYLGASTKNGSNNYIIAGTDSRGTAYGVFSISEKIGVNPWYWWADVPVKQQKQVQLSSSPFFSKTPSVAFRGIFLNDEDWGLQPWAAKTFEKETGDIGPKTYAKIFELLLRLKANTIWPAMHPSTKAFFHYPGNPKMAEKYNIVVGTSHAEPMLRNNVDEWTKNLGAFDYKKNKAGVYAYWEERVKQSKNFDGIYTIGMRGVHDSGMEGVSGIEETSEVLKTVINDQRGLLQKHLGKPANKVPQVFTVYKEVLQVYNHGLQIPDDITLMWTDDNYGYIRRLGNPQEQKRAGGNGVYTHISYWGRPHDYLWLSTMAPALQLEEMTKAYQMGATKIWIVNVGDIKPAEYDMQLFLDMAYDITPFLEQGYLQKHSDRFYSNIFGVAAGRQITALRNDYYRLAYERKPEYMGWSRTEPTTEVKDTDYTPFAHGDEIQKRLDAYNDIAKESDKLYNSLSEELKDAYYQLVHYPVKGSQLMNQKQLYRDLTNKYAAEGRIVSETYKQKSLVAYDSIIAITEYYNSLRGGKWNHMMSMAPRNLPVFHKPVFKNSETVQKDLAGFCAEGSGQNTLPTFYNGFSDSYFIDVYLKKDGVAKWQFNNLPKWLVLSKQKGVLNADTPQERIYFKIDWAVFNENKTPVYKEITLKINGEKYPVKVNVSQYGAAKENGFYEKNGFAVAYAKSFENKTDAKGFSWRPIKQLGYSNEVLQAVPLNEMPLDTVNVTSHPKLTYTFFTETDAPKAALLIGALPTHPLTNNHKVRIALQWNNLPVQIINFQTYDREERWKQNVLANLAKAIVPVNAAKAGKHTLTVYMIDQGVCLDFMYLNTKGLPWPYALLPETNKP